MKQRAARVAWLCCALSLGFGTPALADHPVQRVNTASAGWPIGGFALVDPRGAPFTQDNLYEHWTLLLLEADGHCGAPCDAALSALAGLVQRIHATRAIKSVQVVLVSPAADGSPPERMGQHLARLDPRFIAAAGSRSTLQRLADDLGVALPGLASEASPTSLYRSGTGSIWVIGPDGILRTELLPPFDVLLLTAEFMKTRARR
jgi:protein SCO1/2